MTQRIGVFWLSLLFFCLPSCNFRHSKVPSDLLLKASPGAVAFQSTVYAHVRMHCIECHSWRQPPLFAQDNVDWAYVTARSYANFSSVGESLFVYRTTNGHCGEACRTDGSQMESLIREWWEKGEKDMMTSPIEQAVSTPSIAMPDCEGPQAGYKRLSWSLDGVSADLSGAFFEVQVQRFDKASYRFRYPRLITGDGAVEVRGIRFQFDEKGEVSANAYSEIHQIAKERSAPVLSARTMLVSHAVAPKTVRAVFDLIQSASARHCQDVAQFEKSVVPVFSASCTSCHAKMAFPQFVISEDVSETCDSALQRVDWAHLTESPLITFPLQGKEHQIGTLGRAGAETLLQWMKTEAEKRNTK